MHSAVNRRNHHVTGVQQMRYADDFPAALTPPAPDIDPVKLDRLEAQFLTPQREAAAADRLIDTGELDQDDSGNRVGPEAEPSNGFVPIAVGILGIAVIGAIVLLALGRIVFG